jgi:hypothetical protein
LGTGLSLGASAHDPLDASRPIAEQGTALGIPDNGLASSAGRIAFRTEGPPLSGLLWRAAGALALVTLIAFAVAFVAKRYAPGLRGYSSDGKSRVQLLETRRITPRLTLLVVEFEGRHLLLAQSGDRVVEVGATMHESKAAAIEED